MSISIEEVDRIANLARLKFTDQEKQKLQSEMSAILDYADQLQKISNKSNHVSEVDADGVNLMRDDVVEVLTEPEVFLKQAPAREGDYLKVKSVLE